MLERSTATLLVVVSCSEHEILQSSTATQVNKEMHITAFYVPTISEAQIPKYVLDTSFLHSVSLTIIIKWSWLVKAFYAQIYIYK